MGYGKRAIQLLKNYYEGKFTSLNENMDQSEDENGLFHFIDKLLFLIQPTL